MMLLKLCIPSVPAIWLISLVIVECKNVRVKIYDNTTTTYNITNNNTMSNNLVKPNNITGYNVQNENTIGVMGIDLEYVPIFDSSSLMITRGLQSRNTQAAGFNSLPNPASANKNRLATDIYGRFFLHSMNSMNELAASIQASAQGNYPVTAGTLSGSAEGLFTSVTKSSENTLSWTGFFTWSTEYEWNVNQWTEMTYFIDRLDKTMTKAQFVQKYGRYVPNGFSLGCTVKHQISVSCQSTETTSKFETTLKASLKGSNYDANFVATLKGVIGNNNRDCSFAGSAQIIGPTNLLSTPLITSIDDIQTLLDDVKKMPSICANADPKNLGYVRVRYMPWKFVDQLPDQWKSDVDQDDKKNIAVQSDFLRLKSLLQANAKYESDITYTNFRKLRFYNRNGLGNWFDYSFAAWIARGFYQQNWMKFTNEVIPSHEVKSNYDMLYEAYKSKLKPERYVIEVKRNRGNNNYDNFSFHNKGQQIIVDENDKDKIYIADGKCLKTSWLFWECYDFRAIVDFTGFAPKFTVERFFKGQPDGKTIIDLSRSSIINTPSAVDQTFPGMNCYKGDSWCFISAPKDDWFFILIRPV